MTIYLKSDGRNGFKETMLDSIFQNSDPIVLNPTATRFVRMWEWFGNAGELEFLGENFTYDAQGHPVGGTITEFRYYSSLGDPIVTLSGLDRDIADVASYFTGTTYRNLLTALGDIEDMVLGTLSTDISLYVRNTDFTDGYQHSAVLAGAVGSDNDDSIYLALNPDSAQVLTGGGGLDRGGILVDTTALAVAHYSLDTHQGTVDDFAFDQIEVLTLSSQNGPLEVNASAGMGASGSLTYTSTVGQWGRIDLSARTDAIAIDAFYSIFTAVPLSERDNPFSITPGIPGLFEIEANILGMAEITLGSGDDLITLDGRRGVLGSSFNNPVFERAVIDGGAGIDRLTMTGNSVGRDQAVDGLAGTLSQISTDYQPLKIAFSNIEELVLWTGDDVVENAQIFDSVDLGAGADMIALKAGGSATKVTLGLGVDRVRFEGGTATITDFELSRDFLDLDAITDRLGVADIIVTDTATQLRWSEPGQEHSLTLTDVREASQAVLTSDLIALYAEDSSDGYMYATPDVVAVFGDDGIDLVYFTNIDIDHPVFVTLGGGVDRVIYAGGADVVFTDFTPGEDELVLSGFFPERTRPEIIETDDGLLVRYGNADGGAGESLYFLGLDMGDLHQVMEGTPSVQRNVANGAVAATPLTYAEMTNFGFDKPFDAGFVWLNAVLDYVFYEDIALHRWFSDTRLSSSELVYEGAYGSVTYKGQGFAGTVDAYGVVQMSAGIADTVIYEWRYPTGSTAGTLFQITINDEVYYDSIVFQTTIGEVINMADLTAGITLARTGDFSGLNAMPELPQRYQGLAGDDIVYGSSRTDWLDGGSGDEIFIPLGGDDMIIGETGSDTVVVESGFERVIADLAAGTLRDGYGGQDTLVAVENVISGQHDDILRGSSMANTLQGGAGDDWIEARGGNDTLVGGDGKDWFVLDPDTDNGAEIDLIFDFEPGTDKIVIVGPRPDALPQVTGTEDVAEGVLYTLDLGEDTLVVGVADSWEPTWDDFIFARSSAQQHGDDIIPLVAVARGAASFEMPAARMMSAEHIDPVADMQPSDWFSDHLI